MTIKEFCKKQHLPEMVYFGEMKNFKYYVEKNTSATEDVGIPMVVVESKNKNSFDVCNANTAMTLLDLFKE